MQESFELDWGGVLLLLNITPKLATTTCNLLVISMYNDIVLFQKALEILLATRRDASQLSSSEPSGFASVIKRPTLRHMSVAGGAPVLGTTIGPHDQRQTVSTHANGASFRINQCERDYNVRRLSMLLIRLYSIRSPSLWTALSTRHTNHSGCKAEWAVPPFLGRQAVEPRCGDLQLLHLFRQTECCFGLQRYDQYLLFNAWLLLQVRTVVSEGAKEV